MVILKFFLLYLFFFFFFFFFFIYIYICISRRTAAFANCVMVSPSAVSLVVGKDTVPWK